jgi:hypothetical protein
VYGLFTTVKPEHNRIEVELLDMFSRIQQPKFALSLAVVGALSFWLPDVAMHIAARNFDGPHVWAITFLMPTTFLFAYAVARRFAMKRKFKWVGAVMLLGVWLTGGLFMTLAATASGGGFAGPNGVRGGFLMALLSILPPVTYMFAAYDGSLFALLGVSVGALLLWGIRASWMRLPF